MIDHLISDQTKKFGLIWSYIFQVMTFLIFKNFSKFFKIYLDLFNTLFWFKWLKKYFHFSHANMAANATKLLACHHVTTYARATWYMRTCVFARM